LFRKRDAPGDARSQARKPDDEERGLGDREEGERQEEVKFDWLDILAFTIATFEIILPMLVAFVGIILLIYLVLRFLAR